MARQTFVYILRFSDYENRQILAVRRNRSSAIFAAEKLGLYESGRGWRTTPDDLFTFNDDGEFAENELVIEKHLVKT